MRTTAAAIALTFIATTSAAAQASDAGAEQHQAAVDAINAAYADLLGVSVPEAVAYQRKVGKAIELHERFRNRPDYAGFRVAPGKVFRATFSFTGDAQAALRGATSDPDFEPRQVEFAAADIQQALNKVVPALRNWKKSHTVYFDSREQKIKVHVLPGADVKGVLSGVAVGIPVEVVEDGMIVQTTAYIEGGRLTQSSQHNYTSGFSVVHNDGRHGITTVGHAENTALTIDANSIAWAGEIYGSRDLQWHSSTAHNFPPQVWIGTTNALLTIEQINSLGEGIPVCMQGYVNRNRCGRTINLYNYGTDNNGYSYSNAVSFQRDDGSKMVSKGDSGAPMVTADYGIGRAHGVEFGGTNPLFVGSNDFKIGYYVKSSDFYLLNLTIKTRPPY